MGASKREQPYKTKSTAFETLFYLESGRVDLDNSAKLPELDYNTINKVSCACLEKQAAQCNVLQNNKGNKHLSQRKQVQKVNAANRQQDSDRVQLVVHCIT